MGHSPISTSTNSQVLDKYHEIELEKIYDAILTIQNIRMQLGTFIGTANIAILAAGFSQGKAILILISSIVPWIFILIEVRTRFALLIYSSRAIQLRKKFAPGEDEEDEFSLDFLLRLEARERAAKAMKVPDIRKRRWLLYRIASDTERFIGFRLPWLLSLAQSVMALVLWKIFKWPLL